MKLVVPCLREVMPADSRLVRLAEFLGIECQLISLSKSSGSAIGPFASIPADKSSCLVINPSVIREWTQGEAPAPQFLSSLTSPFRTLLVHAVRSEPFHSKLVSLLTGGCFHAVQEFRDGGAGFTVADDCPEMCKAFAGLSIGAADTANDRIFVGGEGARKFINLGDGAFFATARMEDRDVFLVGSEDVADLDAKVVEGSWLTDLFSRFIPHAMALRHVFGDHCWHPGHAHASVIIDDPLLRPSYGFLNFERLLQLMQEHNFRSTIAFIPHNFRRNSARTVRLFSENADRLSLCFHGNDHTGAEFAVSDTGLLHAMLCTAKERMAAHSRITGLPCERVMVFPQGRFSKEAMAALRSHNFDAAVNTVSHPWREPAQLTLREFSQPAAHRYGGFPLFVRKPSRHMQYAEIAFRLFFGIPLVLVEHHDTFGNPRALIEAVDRINLAAPDIRWSSAGAAVRQSILCRRDHDGTLHVKAFAGTVRTENPSLSPQRVMVEWSHSDPHSGIESVCRDGLPCHLEAQDSRVRVSAVLDPATSALFSIRHRPIEVSPVHTGLRSKTHAIIRRRLSEFRDNYISKSPSLLAAAKSLQRRVQ